MNINSTLPIWIALALILTGCESNDSPYDYTITELNYGNEPENIVFVPKAINSDGTIVGISVHETHLVSLVYQQNSMVEPPELSPQIFVGFDINEQGTFVGFSWMTSHAFLYGNDGSTNLADFLDTTEFTSSFAFGLNNHNNFVGTLGQAGYASTAFVFENQTLSYIDMCNSDLSRAEARDINDNGTIVGFCTDTAFEHFNTFIRYQDEFMLLEIEGRENLLASEINDHDVIVGSYTTAENELHGFTYNLQTEAFDDIGFIGTRPVMNINNQGVVIITGDVDKLIYNPDKGLKKLEELVDLSEWQSIREINGINDKGQIVGYGTNALGENRGFILNPTSHRRQ